MVVRSTKNNRSNSVTRSNRDSLFVLNAREHKKVRSSLCLLTFLKRLHLYNALYRKYSAILDDHMKNKYMKLGKDVNSKYLVLQRKVSSSSGCVRGLVKVLYVNKFFYMIIGLVYGWRYKLSGENARHRPLSRKFNGIKNVYFNCC